MSHSTEFNVVFIVCVVLVAGAATRALARRVRFPYTVAMMLLGLAVGLFFARVHTDSAILETLAVLREGAGISSNMILFVFLPALVFESAYGVDQHALFKERGAVLVLALPVLLISTGLIGGGMYAIAHDAWQWTFPAALVFGALISATDPVAVVAILREVSAPKRLGVLIEGESLLNDGTAIVVFMVLLDVLINGGSAFDPNATVVRFLIVVSGGVAIGLLLGTIISWWMARTFNDPMVEISHTVVVAYLAMLVAEHLLHVSGVIAIVVAAMYLSGRGRTSTSPEVTEFLHKFWELLSYIANTLIFFLVGLVISEQLFDASILDLLLILAAYGVVMVARFALTFSFRPVLAAVGSPLSTQEATVISWGGLRGAVSLALALYARQELGPDHPIGQKILLVTAGIVLLTVFVNGASAGWLMNRLGLTTRPAGERLAQLSARAGALDRVLERLRELAGREGLQAMDWDSPMRDVARRRARLGEEIDHVEDELAGASAEQRTAGYWLQASSVERTEYWAMFGRGTLGPAALRLMLAEIDRHQDSLACGDLTPPRSRTEAAIRHGDTAIRRLLGRLRRLHFDRVTWIYDVANAEAVASADVLRNLDELGDDSELVAGLVEIRETYERNLRISRQRIEEMRIALPELVAAVEARLARRIQLNAEREEYEALGHEGLISESDSHAAIAAVEERMKRLATAAMRLELPSAVGLCRSTPLFSELDDDALGEIATIAKEHVLAPGEVVVNQGDRGTSVFMVVRGVAEVVEKRDEDERVLDVIGAGRVFGEMALLTGERRSATVRAATTLTLVEIARDLLDELMERHPGMRQHIWQSYAQREFDNTVRRTPAFSHLDRARRERWIADRVAVALEPGQSLTPGPDDRHLFLVAGELTAGERTLTAPALVDLGRHPGPFEARNQARVIALPAPD